MAKIADGGPIRTERGGIMNEPSDDELASYASKDDLAAHSIPLFWDSDWGENPNGQRADFPGNPSIPKRTGSPPKRPSSQRQKVPGKD